MAVDRFLILSGIGALTGPFLFLKGFKNFQKRQLILNTPTAKIRSMAIGLVEVNGVVESRSLVTAPFSGRTCTYWQVDVAVRVRNGWNVVHTNSSGNPFFLRDETGLAVVYPRGADCRLNHGVEETCFGLNLPEMYAAYLAESNVKMRFMWRLYTLRFRERLMEEGQRVYVLGTAVPKPMVHVVSEAEELAATGTDGDPWTRRVQDRSREATAIIRQGDNEKLFMISQTPESELTVMLGLESWLQIIGGPILAIAGLAYLLSAVH